MSRRQDLGFTLIEMLIALAVGLIVASAALSFVGTTYRTQGGDEVREEVYRNARYAGMSLGRDMQLSGVALTSTPSFGTLSAWNDTVVILRVPFDPAEAPIHALTPPLGPTPPLYPGQGTCGTNCVDVEKGATLDLKAGDLARLNVNATRRLILVKTVVDNNGNGQGGKKTVQVTFTDHATLLHQPAGLSGNLLLSWSATTVQRLAPIIYYPDVPGKRLMRAERLKVADGSPDGEVLAYGVQDFKVWLKFLDGHEASTADPALAGSGYDDVVGARITATFSADRPDVRLNQGQLFTRSYEWRFTPRNLLWQRNDL
jgi:prepilin-type N-terminal cleavage/methylation domain-containing protein